MKSNYQNGNAPTESSTNLFELKSIIETETNQEFINDLRELGYICKDRIYPTQKHIDSGGFVIKDYVNGSDIVSQIFVSTTLENEILGEFGVRVNRNTNIECDRYGDPIFSDNN